MPPQPPGPGMRRFVPVAARLEEFDMLSRIRRPRLLLAVFGVLAPCAALSQSALTLWDSVVDHPDFSEAELLRIAQFARAEMTLFDTHLELCQQVQPESAEDFAALTTHFEEIGAPVLEFL